ncbi:arylamine N-acetyltransferase [Saccharothrix tamanrassetensis]|uniref:Arylamine N-acetyltransferase n=1 Tax=Saccharothrix tamanrassetensis TaxID=1051531 RepID=A0A841CGR3_9PSEU|nr:arylamine N-acetyltransferase [Saccharothrix tamanrassetensis]MBB5955327.1 arylamine N-acetyltransferase [Saccharothrix tamanrassetensis]
MTDTELSAVLRRVGLTSAEPPSVAALTRLHQAFVERVPYETVEIQLGRVTSLDPAESLARILRGRGGYCFHLNGALAEVLRALGYHVTRHLGGVQMTPDAEPVINRHHLVLTVRDLPDSEDAWLVDAGLGDGLHSPLPLREGSYRQGPFTFRLRPSWIAPGGWRLEHDPRGSLHAMDFAPGPAGMPDFAERHVHLSTSPDSGFVRTFGVQRTDASGWDTLRALTLTRTEDTKKKTVLETPAEWFEALADVYGLTFEPDERDVLWRKAYEQHEAHVNPAVDPSS